MRDVAVEGDKKGCVTIAIWLVNIRVFLDQKFDYVVQSPLYGESETRLVDLRTTLQNFRRRRSDADGPTPTVRRRRSECLPASFFSLVESGTTLSITTLSIRSFYVTLSISDTQHKRHAKQCTAIMFSIAFYLLLCRTSLC